MKKLVLAALVGLFAFGAVAATSTVQAAPGLIHCTGVNGVWDDSDIVHLTKQGAGTLAIGWTAQTEVMLSCTTGGSTTTQVARIQERIQVHVMPNGVTQGQGQVRVSIGNRHRVFNGRFTGMTTLNQGTLSLAGDFNGDGDVDGRDFLRMKQQGTIDRGTSQFTSHVIDSIVFDTSTQR